MFRYAIHVIIPGDSEWKWSSHVTQDWETAWEYLFDLKFSKVSIDDETLGFRVSRKGKEIVIYGPDDLRPF